MKRVVIRIVKLKIRLTTAFKILFGRRQHWVLLEVSTAELADLLQDKSFDVGMTYHGVRPYIFFKMIKQAASAKDDIDMALDKAQFEAEASTYKR